MGQMNNTVRVEPTADANNSRSAHIKNLVADRIKEEELRHRLVNNEIFKVKHGPRASSADRRRTEVLFPTTTNQENHNEE